MVVPLPRQIEYTAALAGCDWAVTVSVGTVSTGPLISRMSNFLPFTEFRSFPLYTHLHV